MTRRLSNSEERYAVIEKEAAVKVAKSLLAKK